MKTYLALAASFAALLVARSVFPCGAPFGTGIEANPQQDIIVAYKNGVETYVFQPTFCGTASNFGLILPVPSTLTASPALSDQQAFTTVDLLSQPTYVTVTSCYPRYNGSGGAAGGTTTGVDASTSVVASGHVGFLDWVQLKADTEESFTDWLTTNGYSYSPAASSVFSYYVQKGWYFVAFKISQGAVPAEAARFAKPWVRSSYRSAPQCRSCPRAWRARAPVRRVSTQVVFPGGSLQLPRATSNWRSPTAQAAIAYSDIQAT
jgi:hypothetical protein